MVPKESGLNLSETACGLCVCKVKSFLCSPAMARDGEIIHKGSIFVITETQFAIQGQDT